MEKIEKLNTKNKMKKPTRKYSEISTSYNAN